MVQMIFFGFQNFSGDFVGSNMFKMWNFLDICNLFHKVDVILGAKKVAKPRANSKQPKIQVLGQQKVAFWKGNGTPYFRKIEVGEILSFGQFCMFAGVHERGTYILADHWSKDPK